MQSSAKLSNEQRLTLYAFFKQASLGKCTGEKPSAIDMVARAKYESWFSLGEMPAATAKQQYVGLVQELFPHFDVTGERNEPRQPHPLAERIDAGDVSMAGAVSMPTVDMSAPEWQVQEDVFHFASTGDVAKIKEALARGSDVDAKDEEGRTMLHWAVDRSQREMVELLLAHHATPDVQDTDGMTPLHYAVNCEDEEMAQLLVNGGASADIEDNDGETPLSCATDAIQELLARGAQA
ncbi:hypothetical protein PINS_up021642 [Pythium insidiosum]|nr:hypothetical protein PINS_up021642 [Pythium insidiosum]